MISACCRLPFRVCMSRTPCRRPISSRERNRESRGRRLGLMLRVGFMSMCPQAIAKFMICRRTPRPLFAPPGAVPLKVSNQRLTCGGVMRSSGFDPKAGSMRLASTARTPFFVEGLYRSK